MFMNERQRVEIRRSDSSVREGCVEESALVINKREHIRARIRFQRAEEHFFRAAEGGQGVEDKRCTWLSFQLLRHSLIAMDQRSGSQPIDPVQAQA